DWRDHPRRTRRRAARLAGHAAGRDRARSVVFGGRAAARLRRQAPARMREVAPSQPALSAISIGAEHTHAVLMRSARRRSSSPEPFSPALRVAATWPSSVTRALPTYHDGTLQNATAGRRRGRSAVAL